jgi:hypothetical protein
LMRAIVENEPRPLDDTVDPRLAELIAWGMCKERSERPSSIQELGRELARWLLARGVTEDVCGSALEAKWISRLPQKSMPLLMEPVDVPKPVSPRTDTLVSPRLSAIAIAEPREPKNVPVPAAPLVPRRAWALAVIALGGSVAWILADRGGSSPAAVSPAVVEASAASSRSAPPAAPAGPSVPIEIASSPPAPSVSAPAPPVHSASPLPSRAPASKSREPGKPVSADKPARDVHDETQELLQAY